jgi:Mucin-like glycoprotein
MPPIWNRRHDPVENLLRASRPAPRSEYAASVLANLEGERRRFRVAGLRRRVLIAGFVTALAAGAAIAAGATTTVASSVNGLVQVATHGVNGNGGDNGNGNGNGNGQGNGQGSTDTTTTTAETTTAETTTAETTTAETTTAETTTAATTTTTAETTTAAAPAVTTTTTTTDTPTGGAPVAPTVNQNDNSGGFNGNENPGDRQYAVTICHHTGSDTNPWVELVLSPQGAAQHLANHPDDFIVGMPDNCPSKK